MRVQNELKLKVLTDMGLKPHLEGNEAVAVVPYSFIVIKILKARRGSAKIRVSFEYNGKEITQIQDTIITENSSLRIGTTDGLKCEGTIKIS